MRWSLDLRWQNPSLPDGAFGLKRPIIMSRAGQEQLEIDWAGWADVDKKSGSADGLKDVDAIAGVLCPFHFVCVWGGALIIGWPVWCWWWWWGGGGVLSINPPNTMSNAGPENLFPLLVCLPRLRACAC